MRISQEVSQSLCARGRQHWPAFIYSTIPKALVLEVYAANDLYFVKAGPDLTYSYTDGSEPLVVNGVLRGDPAYTSLFTGQPTAAETVTLTGQKYCLQMQGDGFVVCSYGTSSEDTPLVFTATAGDTVFTPTDTDAWMLTAGQYVWPVFIDPGTSSVSHAGTVGGNGASFDTSGDTSKSLSLQQALEGAPTIAPLIEMGVSSSELADGDLFNVLTADGTASHGLYYGCDATGPYIATTDGAMIIKEYTSWDRGSYLILGMIAPTSSTFKLLWQRFDSDGLAVDTSLQYSSAETYDGSLDPDTRLTIFVDNTAPIGIVALEIFNEPMGEDDTTKRLISKMLAAVAAKSAVEADSAPDGSLAFGDDYLMFGDDYITL